MLRVSQLKQRMYRTLLPLQHDLKTEEMATSFDITIIKIRPEVLHVKKCQSTLK